MPAPTQLLRGFEKKVATAKANPAKRTVIFDESTTGLCLIVSPKGRKTLTVVARNPDGKQVWVSLGVADELTVADAREQARQAVANIKRGLPAIPQKVEPPKPETFKDIADRFLKRHVRKEGQKDGQGNPVPALRSAPAIERQFRDLIGPELDALPFADIKRHHVAKLRDKVADEKGPVMADRVLASLSTLFRQEIDHMPDEWSPPIVRRVTKAKERERKRILTDDEIRTIWTAIDKVDSEAIGKDAKARPWTFGAFVKIALLTGQRRAKVARMRWDDIADDIWTIATEQREKGNADRLKLPVLALGIIDSLPRIEGNPFVFAGRGGKAIAGFGEGKVDLDKAALIAPWAIHDLRRTARSLMSRARVDREIAERVLGHAITGVEGVYDRHAYFDEKAEALRKLAALVELILNPQRNVLELRA